MRRSAFEIYLRTGRRVPEEAEEPETKFNPWHDPNNGQFTFAGQGRRFGAASADTAIAKPRRPAASGAHGQVLGTRSTSGSGRPNKPGASPSSRVARPKVGPGPEQDSTTRLSDPVAAIQRTYRESAPPRSAPSSHEVLVRKFKRRMLDPEVEGSRSDVFLDSQNVLTVGIGHKIVPEDRLKLGDWIGDRERDAFWRQDAIKALTAAAEQARQAEIDDEDFLIALADVNFQLGKYWRTGFKNTWALILNRDYIEAAREAQDSDWFRQTPKRVRAFQAALLALSAKTRRKSRY